MYKPTRYQSTDKRWVKRENHDPSRFRTMPVYDLTKVTTAREKYDEWSRINLAIKRILDKLTPKHDAKNSKFQRFHKKKSKR